MTNMHIFMSPCPISSYPTCFGSVMSRIYVVSYLYLVSLSMLHRFKEQTKFRHPWKLDICKRIYFIALPKKFHPERSTNRQHSLDFSEDSNEELLTVKYQPQATNINCRLHVLIQVDRDNEEIYRDQDRIVLPAIDPAVDCAKWRQINS